MEVDVSFPIVLLISNHILILIMGLIGVMGVLHNNNVQSYLVYIYTMHRGRS